MQPSVTAVVLQGTRMSLSDASESRSGSRAGTGIGTGIETEQEQKQKQKQKQKQEWEWDCQWTFPMGAGTISDGCVNRDRQHQMDMSTETDSIERTCRTDTDNIRRTCRTARWISSDGRVEQRDGQYQTDMLDRDR